MVKFFKLMSGNWAFVKAFNGLIRRIQTTVEHVRVSNNTGVTIDRGEVIRLTSGQREAALAQSNNPENVEWAAIMAEPTPDGESGIARINGYAYVLFIDDLDPAPAAGDEVFVSATAGRATNAQDGWVKKIGVVGDGTPYATEGAAYVFLQPCCSPQQVARG